MAEFRNYDPALVVATFKGILLQGFMEGTFILGERNEDTFAPAVGAQGDVTRVRSRNKTGLVTMTLMAESPSNDLLSNVMLLDEEFGLGVGPILVKDLNNTSLLLAEDAWIQKPPAGEYSTDATSREWIIACASLSVFIGGSVV